MSISDFWMKNYCDHTFCSLCGNLGIIDTRQTAVLPQGIPCGRLNWCICPNGRKLSRLAKGRLPEPKDLDLQKRLFSVPRSS